MFLYEVTSTFLEGRALANPKAKRGYSRDHRPDCKQVWIGLAVNRDGFLRIRRRSTPEPAHRELYQTLGIGSEVVPPRKTWSRREEVSK